MLFVPTPRNLRWRIEHRRTQLVYSYTLSKEEVIYRNAPQRRVSKAAATTVPPDALSLFTT